MKTILIKISGELFSSNTTEESKVLLHQIANQIKELLKKHKIGLVLGAGNIFRGNEHGKKLNLQPTAAHTVGMVATIINGLILQDVFKSLQIPCVLFSAIQCQQVACVIKQASIDKALQENNCLIFVGGTGNPYFTTDTNAVLRALQIGAHEVWKGTKVDGIYSDDPQKNKDCKFLKEMSYKEFVEQNLKVMDLTAITLANQHSLKIRVFDVFLDNALINVNKNNNFGSTIS